MNTINTINRLQFRHHTPIFDTREEAIEYIYSQIRFADSGLAFEDKKYGFSLLAEPTVIRYKNEEDENDPHVILAVGSVTNESTQYNENKFCIIDIDKTESEIAELWEELEKAIASLTIITRDTNTLKLYSQKTDDGTIISGDVVVASSQIFDDARKPNIILNTDDGIFTYVNMEYDKENDKITFTVNGDTQEWLINNNYLIRGYYSKKDESLHLIRKDDVDITISLENLIDEWGVEGEATNTPIVLTKEEIGYGDEALHNHVEPWQDLLKADVRLADRRYNVLKKTSDGRYLYVDGLASNITYFKNGEEISVQEALNQVTKTVSNDSTNIIYEKADGYYAKANLTYVPQENTLVFTTSNVTGGTSTNEIKLNSVEVFKKIYYDPTTENLIILYVDANGEMQEVDIPIGEWLTKWEWDIQNEGHNVKLHKERVIAGNDKVSADAAIYDDPDNILVDKNHELFVKGTADNIKYGDGTVESELDKLNADAANINARLNETSGKVDTLRTEFDAEVSRATSEEARIEGKINNEITRSTDKDNEHDSKIYTIEQTIGDGFSPDGHQTVTYKFNDLSNKLNTVSSKTDTTIANLNLLSAKTEAEIVRAKGEEQRIEKKFDDALGDGFNIRNTVRDEFYREKTERMSEDARLQAQINEISGSSSGKISDIINIDHSIDVDKTDATKPIVSVNLSREMIDTKPNIIKLNNDGLYAGVDLEYVFAEDTGTNTLYFSTTNGRKKIDLKTNSVVDKIYYDPTREAIIIEYTVNGKRMPDVVVPVADLITEWRASESTNGAIKLTLERVSSGSTPHGQDVLYAETVISEHEDNILVNDHGALYVSNADIEQNKADINGLKDRMDGVEGDITTINTNIAEEAAARESGDDDLRRLIHAEEDRATAAESAITHNLEIEIQTRENEDTALNTKIDNEITRASSEEARIEAKLDNEITRSTNKDNDLQTQITTEATTARAAESSLREGLTTEIANRTTADANLQTQISNEVTRAQGAEQVLQTQLDAETAARELEDEKIWAKIRPIEFYDTTTIHNERVRNSGETVDEVRHYVIVAQGNDNIVVANDTKGGVYATVSLDYDEPTNTLVLKGTDGMVLSTQQLGAGSLLDSITYDPAEKDLVISYHSADGTSHTMNFPVAELFNEWEVQNPSEGSALELHKVNNSGETGNVDILWGKVLLTRAVEHPDHTVDYGDNIIRIVNNGLYASGSAITEALDTATCAQSELKKIEEVVLGNELGQGYPCGEGYTYPKYAQGCFINTATSMYDADKILDTKLCEVSSKVECNTAETKSIENVLGITANCDSNVVYPKTQGCMLSAATSFAEADAMLETELCKLIHRDFIGEKTPTATLTVTDDGSDKKFQADVRLSHGNDESKWQTDAELKLTSTSDPEFTDTNVLREIALGGQDADAKYNGVYLSNVWDCGQYTENGTGTPYNKYKIDDSAESMNHFTRRYRNGVRYQ